MLGFEPIRDDLKVMLLHTVPSPSPSGRPAEDASPTDRLATLRRRWVVEALLAGLLLGCAAAAVGRLGGFSPWFAPKVLALFAAVAALVWLGLATHGQRAFGAANRVTVLRLALALGLAACLGEPIEARPVVAWLLVGVATLAAVLDAADGPLARAGGLASDFGGRFDMETDAFLLLVLCGLLMQLDKTGPWVLAAGLLRHAFVAAAAVRPWLARPLPPSLRRKAVCVAQIVCLIVGLGPVIGPGLASTLAALGLAALLYSFAVDVAWLARRRYQPWETPA